MRTTFRFPDSSQATIARLAQPHQRHYNEHPPPQSPQRCVFQKHPHCGPLPRHMPRPGCDPEARYNNDHHPHNDRIERLISNTSLRSPASSRASTVKLTSSPAMPHERPATLLVAAAATVGRMRVDAVVSWIKVVAVVSLQRTSQSLWNERTLLMGIRPRGDR